MTSSPAVLVLEDGTHVTGESFGALGRAVGELTATTAMTGYQETLSSGTVRGSIVMFTAPHIGNTGVNSADTTRPPQARGVILREAPRQFSNWRATRSLDEDLANAGVVGITGVDTRAIMRRLHTAGAMRVGIFTGTHAARAGLVEEVRTAQLEGADALIARASTPEAYSAPAPSDSGGAVPGSGLSVAVVDLGLGAELAAALRRRGAEVMVLPGAVSFADVAAARPDRVAVSGGPGNPADATTALGLMRELLESEIPMMAFGLGHQILARALGYTTTALTHPHHGVNYPVQDHRTGKVDITCHSHAYTVDLTGAHGVEITHTNLNDGTVEGFALANRPVRGLQFHPDASYGPSDAHHLIDSFLTKET